MRRQEGLSKGAVILGDVLEWDQGWSVQSVLGSMGKKGGRVADMHSCCSSARIEVELKQGCCSEWGGDGCCVVGGLSGPAYLSRSCDRLEELRQADDRPLSYLSASRQQAQALGDYCHLLVARLPYTTLPDRLDLVPEKRFLLPHHLPHLLEALLHDPAEGEGGGGQQQQQRIAAALGSEARAHLDRALALAGSVHQGYGQGGLAHLRDVLLGPEEQV
ncbi:hypothetical protein HPB48_022333 [Haemaphysalis longicornis]|uniref:Uncharacterized protein n=1 Tax=Haemaphysalis longicornis TaxID=44386 RepID=A0A9J6H3M9_HAELO|nr:hypothetical protein HPB48_022333 [Haemaphysalis longicornis]